MPRASSFQSRSPARPCPDRRPCRPPGPPRTGGSRLVVAGAAREWLHASLGRPAADQRLERDPATIGGLIRQCQHPGRRPERVELPRLRPRIGPKARPARHGAGDPTARVPPPVPTSSARRPIASARGAASLSLPPGPSSSRSDASSPSLRLTPRIAAASASRRSLLGRRRVEQVRPRRGPFPQEGQGGLAEAAEDRQSHPRVGRVARRQADEATYRLTARLPNDRPARVRPGGGPGSRDPRRARPPPGWAGPSPGSGRPSRPGGRVSRTAASASSGRPLEIRGVEGTQSRQRPEGVEPGQGLVRGPFEVLQERDRATDPGARPAAAGPCRATSRRDGRAAARGRGRSPCPGAVAGPSKLPACRRPSP